MKRLIFVFFLLCSSSFAATWFATSTGVNMSAVVWRGTIGASCAGSGTTLTWAARAAGDVFDSNGCAAINMADGVDPGANGKVVLTTDGTNTGGGFTCVTSTGPTNITADLTATASASPVVSISGTSGTKCNLGTNIVTVTLTGGSVSGAYAVADSHSVVSITHYANLVGGSNVSAFAYNFTAPSGAIVVNGTATGTSGSGFNITSTATATITNCVGSDTTNVVGCQGTGAGTITVTGNIIFGKRAAGANAAILYTPSASNCVLLMGAAAWASTPAVCTATDGTHQQLPSDSNIKTQSTVTVGTVYGSYTGTNNGGTNSGTAQ